MANVELIALQRYFLWADTMRRHVVETERVTNQELRDHWLPIAVLVRGPLRGRGGVPKG